MKSLLLVAVMATFTFSDQWTNFIKKELYDIAKTYDYFTFADWDNDGLTDVIIVDNDKYNQFSTLTIRYNIGTTTDPIFDEPDFLRKENGDTLHYRDG